MNNIISKVCLLILVAVVAAFAVVKINSARTATLSNPESNPAKIITFWSVSESDSDGGKLMENIVSRYEQENPNTKVLITHFKPAEYLQALRAAQEGRISLPDLARDVELVESDDVPGAELIRAGKLLDLTEIAEERAWEKRLRPGLLDYSRRRHGGTFVIPTRQHLAGVTYNRQIFEKLKLKTPHTIAEFEIVLEKLKQAGHAPFAVGGEAESDFLTFYWYALIHNEIAAASDAPENIRNSFLDRKPQISVDSAAFERATVKLKEWYKKGYFDSKFESRPNIPNVLDGFLDGETTMYVGFTGFWTQDRWWIPNRDERRPPQFVLGFFPFPPNETGQRSFATGEPINGLIVFKSENQQIAADLLDYILKSEFGRFMLEGGAIPASPVEQSEQISMAPMVSEQLAALPRLELGALYFRVNPNMRANSLRQVQRDLREVMEDKKTVAEFLAATQKLYLETQLEPNSPPR